jgi:hypothetical protein
MIPTGRRHDMGADMTAGQGGSHEEPAGRPGGEPGPGDAPQGWGAAPPPPGRPGYPPQGYPSYGAAPSAPSGWGAPAPMERPTTVRAGIGAFLANLILGLIASAVAFSDIDGLIARALAQADDPSLSESTLRAGIILGAAIGLAFVALEALFIWFAWQGRNWARVVLWVVGGLGIVSGFAGLASDSTQTSGFLSSLSVIQLLLVIAGVVLLALGPSNAWYAYRTWQRRAGRGR